MKPANDDPSLHPAVIACALIAAAVIILGSLSGDANITLEGWVNRYQTLITGVLAILAARWTVGQMRESDRLQEVRHRQQLAVSERRDRLAADRFLDYVPQVLSYYTQRIERYLDKVPEDRSEVLWDAEVVRRFVVACRAVQWTADLAENERTRECKHLFTPPVQLAFESCAGWAREINAALPKELPSAYGWKGGAPEGYSPVLDLHFEDLLESQKGLTAALDQWAAEIAKERQNVGHL